MSGKHTCDFSGEPKAKKAQKAITIYVRLNEINHFQRGKCVSEVGHVLRLNGSTACTIQDSIKKIKVLHQVMMVYTFP